MADAPTLTLAALRRLDPCRERLAVMEQILPAKGRITAAQARDLGASLDDLIWAASAVASTDPDVARRLRLWTADCAARVLHIYERVGDSHAPRTAITIARAFARGEVREDAWAAARAAARDAARDAESAWQLDRLVARLSAHDPDDWPLPTPNDGGPAQ